MLFVFSRLQLDMVGLTDSSPQGCQVGLRGCRIPLFSMYNLLLLYCLISLGQVFAFALIGFVGKAEALLSKPDLVAKLAVGVTLFVFVSCKWRPLGRLLHPVLWCFFPAYLGCLMSLYLLGWKTVTLSAYCLLGAWASLYILTGLAFRDWRAARSCSWWHLTIGGLIFLFSADFVDRVGYGAAPRMLIDFLVVGVSYALAVALTRTVRSRAIPQEPISPEDRVGLVIAPGGEVYELQRAYGTAYKLELSEGALHLQLWDRDFEDPLRPQSFVLSRSQAEELVRLCRAQQSYSFACGSNKFVINHLQMETEDHYGPHFTLEIEDEFFHKFDELLPRLPADLPPDQRLQQLKDGFLAGRVGRFDPVSEAALNDLRGDLTLDHDVRPLLKSGNTDAVLWAVAFLYARMENKLELVAGLLPVLERETAGPLREAAESSLLSCFSSQPGLFTPGALARIVKTVPWSSGLRAIGSTLRLLSLAKAQLGPYRVELKERRANLRVRGILRPEEESVVGLLGDLIR